MKTRPDGSAFRRSNGAYGRQPTQPRPRSDVASWQHLATPKVANKLFTTCLHTSNVLTSADVKSVIPSEAESISAEAPI